MPSSCALTGHVGLHPAPHWDALDHAAVTSAASPRGHGGGQVAAGLLALALLVALAVGLCRGVAWLLVGPVPCRVPCLHVSWRLAPCMHTCGQRLRRLKSMVVIARVPIQFGMLLTHALDSGAAQRRVNCRTAYAGMYLSPVEPPAVSTAPGLPSAAATGAVAELPVAAAPCCCVKGSGTPSGGTGG